MVCHSHDHSTPWSLPLFPFSQKDKIPNCYLSYFTIHQQVFFWRFQSFLWQCCLSCLTNKSHFLLGRWSVIFIFQWSKHTNVQLDLNQKIVSRMIARKLMQGIYAGINSVWFNHLKCRHLAIAFPLVEGKASTYPRVIHSTYLKYLLYKEWILFDNIFRVWVRPVLFKMH